MTYDANPSVVSSALHNANPVIFSDDTISKILALTTRDNTTVRFDTAAPDSNGNVTVAAGAEVVLVNSSDLTQTTLTPPPNAPVIIFQGRGGVIATINDGQTTVPSHSGVVDRVVVGSAGNDKIIVADARNTEIILGTGNSTVVTGGGVDTVLAGLGNSTITGGTGHSIVQLQGNASDYTVTVNNGHAVVTDRSSSNVTDISKIQYVQLDNGKALVFANDTQQAAITTLYETAFGRTADHSGLQYWFDRAAAGTSLDQIAKEFTQASEFAPSASLSDNAFVTALYQHTFNRAPEADGLAYWLNALSSGGASRAQLIQSFSSIASHNIDGSIHTEATVVGSVTIVHNIV